MCTMVNKWINPKHFISMMDPWRLPHTYKPKSHYTQIDLMLSLLFCINVSYKRIKLWLKFDYNTLMQAKLDL